MADRPRVALFCEDRGHELFVRALVDRLAREVDLRPILQAPSARGGHGRALVEFKLWQASFLRVGHDEIPDLLLVVIDANCSGWNEARRQLEGAIDAALIPHHLVGCPDPHVERWYLADPAAFEKVVGARPGRDQEKCERHFYKRVLEKAVEAAGIPLLTGTADLAPDIVQSMDLYRASKSQQSLGHFIDGLRSALLLLAHS